MSYEKIEFIRSTLTAAARGSQPSAESRPEPKGGGEGLPGLPLPLLVVVVVRGGGGRVLRMRPGHRVVPASGGGL